MSASKSPVDRAVDVLRPDAEPPRGARERIRARLAARMPDIDGSETALGRGFSRAAAANASPRSSRVTMLGVALFVLGGVAGAALHAAWSHRGTAAMTVDRPVSLAVSARQEAPPPPAPSPPPSLVAPLALPSSVAAPPPAPVVASEEVSELRLLDEARAAMVRGDLAVAFERLRRHQRNFPSGVLADERDALRVEALVKDRRYDEARQLAQVLRARAPDSLFMPTVRSAIESIPVTASPAVANPP